MQPATSADKRSFRPWTTSLSALVAFFIMLILVPPSLRADQISAHCLTSSPDQQQEDESEKKKETSEDDEEEDEDEDEEEPECD